MTPAVGYSCVVDASSAAQVHIVEPLTTEARALFALLVDPNTVFYVPDLFYAECASIFWKKARRGDCSDAAARSALAATAAWRLRPTSAFDQFQDALDLALRLGCSAYDASYVVLAGRVGAPLITADQRLVRTVNDPALCVWLGAWAPP